MSNWTEEYLWDRQIAEEEARENFKKTKTYKILTSIAYLISEVKI